MDPRLTIVTNHPARAVLAVLGVDAAPEWVRVITRAEDSAHLAPGSRVIGQWFEPRKYRSALEWAWIERKARGDLMGLSVEDCERLAEWAERRGTRSDVDSSLAAATSGMVISERRIS